MLFDFPGVNGPLKEFVRAIVLTFVLATVFPIFPGGMIPGLIFAPILELIGLLPILLPLNPYL
jgi:hypothetical protein